MDLGGACLGIAICTIRVGLITADSAKPYGHGGLHGITPEPRGRDLCGLEIKKAKMGDSDASATAATGGASFRYARH